VAPTATLALTASLLLIIPAVAFAGQSPNRRAGWTPLTIERATRLSSDGVWHVVISSGSGRAVVIDTLRGTRRTYDANGCVLSDERSTTGLVRGGQALLFCPRQTTPYRLLTLDTGQLTDVGQPGDVIVALGAYWITGGLLSCSVERPLCSVYISRTTGQRYESRRGGWDIDAPAPATALRFCDGTVTDPRAGDAAGPYRTSYRVAGGRFSSLFIAECGRKARLLARNYWSVQLSRRWLTWSWGKSIYSYSTTSRRTTRYTLPAAKTLVGDAPELQVLHTRNRLIVGEPIRYRNDPDDSVTSVERYRIWTRRL
jgi:hypothetical protein